MTKTAAPADTVKCQGSGTCRNCGAEIFYSTSDHAWVHFESFARRCAKEGRTG